MNAPLPTSVLQNGREIPVAEAQISVLGNVLYGAYGVYESIQLWNGVVFHLDDHLRRLQSSADQIDLPLAGDLVNHRCWIERLIKREAATHATIRLFAIGPERDQPPRSFIWLEELRPPSQAMVENGVGGMTYRGERALPTVKSLNTLVNTMARRRAQGFGEHEGILVDRDGNVVEGATSTFYMVEGNRLHLPPVETILSGVTAEITLRLAEKEGLEVVRSPIALAGHEHWDEALISSTSRHLLPLVRLDGRSIADGAPGPVTKRLQRCFEDYFQTCVGAAYGSAPPM